MQSSRAVSSSHATADQRRRTLWWQKDATDYISGESVRSPTRKMTGFEKPITEADKYHPKSLVDKYKERLLERDGLASGWLPADNEIKSKAAVERLGSPTLSREKSGFLKSRLAIDPNEHLSSASFGLNLSPSRRSRASQELQRSDSFTSLMSRTSALNLERSASFSNSMNLNRSSSFQRSDSFHRVYGSPPSTAASRSSAGSFSLG